MSIQQLSLLFLDTQYLYNSLTNLTNWTDFLFLYPSLFLSLSLFLYLFFLSLSLSLSLHHISLCFRHHCVRCLCFISTFGRFYEELNELCVSVITVSLSSLYLSLWCIYWTFSSLF